MCLLTDCKGIATRYTLYRLGFWCWVILKDVQLFTSVLLHLLLCGIITTKVFYR